MNMNHYTVQDANLLSSVEEFAERSAEMTVAILIDFYSKYNQCELHSESCDMMAFQTSLRLLQQTRLSMKATNSVDQFWQIICWILERNQDDSKTYFNDIQIDELKIKYNDEEILSEIWRYMFKHFQHINSILISIELTEAKISGEKSHWCQKDLIVVEFACDYDDHHSEVTKIAKIVVWSPCTNITEARAFIEVCIYYWIWIKDFVIIT